LVASLNRPGGNLTGSTTLGGDQIQKRLQLLHDALPNARVFGVLGNPDNLRPTTFAGRTIFDLAQDTAHTWGAAVEMAEARTVSDFDAAFAALAAKRVDALAVLSDTLFVSGRDQLVALAAKYAIPAIYYTTETTRDGGLMSYSASMTDGMHQIGLYAGRILKGEKPADLPVVLPTKFEFVVNLKTAKALGLTVPPTLLAIADEVIE
jgi:putative ABC transport system substrate-binding protein